MNKFPKRIDVNPTAKCNLRCTFCWGPEHNIPDGIDTQGWEKIIGFFAANGTKEIVFTGGEPLIRPDLAQLLCFAKEQGLRVTLSTNTLLLNEKRAIELLPYVDEIGVPVDGSNPQKNSLMRTSLVPELSKKHFISAMEALPLIRRLNPKIEITIRTVVSKINKNNIIEIGKLLNRQKENWDRWKLYQFTPVSIGAKNQNLHNISTSEFKIIGRLVLKTWPNSSIQIYAMDDRIGKYFFLGPEGGVFGVGNDGMYKRLGLFQEMSKSKLTRAINSLINN
jgi:MoaA/NifB/PqqE/SkfB family radical SAM enzyme